MRNPSSSNQSSRRIGRGRVTAALAAGVITVVVGSIGTVSADAPEGGRTVSVVEVPEARQAHVRQVSGRQVKATEAPDGPKFSLDTFGGGGGGGRANFR